MFDRLKKNGLQIKIKICEFIKESIKFLVYKCNDCIGAALMQRVDNNDCPIAFYSRSMTNAEKNYDTSQKELLAVVIAVDHFRPFLYGKEFIIKTDHHPLTSIKTKSKPSVRLGRWLSELADYAFKIEHKKGADNVLADALSRLNLPYCDEKNMDCTNHQIRHSGKG